MRATVSIAEPNIAFEAKLGDLFVSHASGLQECVFAAIDRDGDVRHKLRVRAVVIACRIGSNEPGYFKTGMIVSIDPDAPITFVEPVEPVAFRQRQPLSHG